MSGDGKIVLSILWTDSDNPNKFKDGHFIITEANQVRMRIRLEIF
jgi:hypothetical protein